MIVTVTANPSLDVTYRVTALHPGREHRVPPAVVRPGGKGVNVASTLRRMGYDPLVLGPTGGPEGAALADALDVEGLQHRLTGIRGTTRRTVTVVADDGEATGFNEPGPTVAPEEWTALIELLCSTLPSAETVVLSGSLPPGVPPDAYAAVITRCREADVPVVLDTHGEALTRALGSRPTVVKPNRDELVAATGCDDVTAAARMLLRQGASAVLASLGPEGMLLVTGPVAEPLACRPPDGLGVVNPTGAGDAAVAGAVAALSEGLSWSGVVHRATAWSAAAVAEAQGGIVDPLTVDRAERALQARAGTHSGGGVTP